MDVRLVLLALVVPLELLGRALLRHVPIVAPSFTFGPRLGARRLLAPTRIDARSAASSYRTRPEGPHVSGGRLPVEVPLEGAWVLRRLGSAWAWVAFAPRRQELYLSLRTEGDEVVLEARRVVSPAMCVACVLSPIVLLATGTSPGAALGVGIIVSTLAGLYVLTDLLRVRRVASGAFDEIEDALADMDESAEP